MKSLASREMSSNSSASKSNSADVTFANVSTSVSPAKGDRPDSLQRQRQQQQQLLLLLVEKKIFKIRSD